MAEPMTKTEWIEKAAFFLEVLLVQKQVRLLISAETIATVDRLIDERPRYTKKTEAIRKAIKDVEAQS